jgi:hypothetical protein
MFQKCFILLGIILLVVGAFMVACRDIEEVVATPSKSAS